MWFNAQQFQPAEGAGGGLPVGKHRVVLTGSDEKMTKANDPNIRMLVFKVQIIEGPHAGISGDYRLNMWNPNAQTVDIAARELSALCHVIGVYQLAVKPWGAELFNRPFMLEIQPQKNDPKYTEVTGVFDLHGNPPSKAGQGPQQGAPDPAQQYAQQPAQQAWGTPPVQPAGGFSPPQQPAGPGPGPAPAWNGAGQPVAPAATPSTNGAAWGGPPNGAGNPPAGPAWGAPR